jgi:glutamyl-tRNA synthetase
MSVRTRFAPSPTGYLHIGGVRTALFNYLFAKQAGGQFILRIDDTDQERNVQEALQPILDGFRWLGLNWDEGPEVGGPCGEYFQSKRLARYQAAAEKLLQSGHAYRDYARTEELQTQREAAEKAGQAFVYDRRWMADTPEKAKQFEVEGRSFVVRLKMPREGKCVLQDVIRGQVEFEWAAEQDHVIQRADGTCLYHLASVVDDEDFQITHVIRAVEHLPNTPRQVFIAQSLGYKLPVYAHLPYVAEPGGTAKLSKRKLDKYLKNKDFAQLFEHGQTIAQRLGVETSPATFNPVVVDFYREIGFLPDAILNYLLLLGWSLDDSTEHFTMQDAIKSFTLERVNKSPASFDPQKLTAFQTRWMNLLSIDDKYTKVLPFLVKAGWVPEDPTGDQASYIRKILASCSDRVKVAGDILQFDDFFVADDQLVYDQAAWDKKFAGDANARALLADYRPVLASATTFEAAALESQLKEFLAQRNAKIGQIIAALRLAVTGKQVGFGMFETIEILGRDRVLARIDRALAKVQ